ncbi:MAG: hypothetical protein JO295_11865 [Verrucomicrobia bacterium]|nr:hypothetical protein [Verrucomicrobiota bacterium]
MAPAPDDEAKRDGKTEADFRYHITRGADGEWTNNYFKGMDAIATVPGTKPEEAQSAGEAAPVDQLLDLDLPKRLPHAAQAGGDTAPAAQPQGSPGTRAGERPEQALVDACVTPNEILGRNTWLAWCGGNEGFWDWLSSHGYGFLDLLRLIDTRNRATRFRDAGLINEPGMREATAPDENGLWLDVPDGGPEDKDRPKPIEKIYGKSSGVVGLRLFKNPNFDKAAQSRWDAGRYYNDPSYYNDPKLVKPYRVGMSCAFCHASFHPLNPPADIANPRWANLSGSIGAQYLRIRPVFGGLLPKESFVYHLLDSQPPGTIDTSLVASDNINNPNAMNAVFGLKQRVVIAFRNPAELQRGGSLTQPALWGEPSASLPDGDDGFVWREGSDHRLEYRGRHDSQAGPGDRVPKAYWDAFSSLGLRDRVKDSNTMNGPGQADGMPRRYVSRILFDGADSIGGWGALARVFLNIGTYWERWIMLHNSLVGFKPQQPFTINDCVTHSVYWNATQERVAALRDYFLKVTPPMPLLATPGGSARILPPSPAPAPRRATAAGRISPEEQRRRGDLTRARHIDVAKLKLGRQVFAHNCIVCHSSIQPQKRFDDYEAWAGKTPPEPWDHDPGQWLRDPEYRKWAENIVETPDFWRDNFLSTDFRVPVTLVGTNSARAVATNGLRGHMWNDFTSEAYKQMPSVGAISYFNPFTGRDESYTPRNKTPDNSPAGGGGIGFYRVPTLISIWTSAPLLHNNSLGLFNNDPSVEGRLDAFDDAITKLLWPAKRLESSSYNGATAERLQRDHGLIWRTPNETYISLPSKYLPSVLEPIPGLGALQRHYERLLARHPRLGWLTPRPWMPSAVLLALAFLAFVWIGRKPSPDPATVSHRRGWARGVGYVFIAASVVVGALLYFVTGSLGNLRIGPIPEGTPVNLLANLNPDADPAELKKALKITIHTLAEINSAHLPQEEAQRRLREVVAPALLKVSRCPDFVMDKGHYYPWFESMTDEDKYALIELLKTF